MRLTQFIVLPTDIRSLTSSTDMIFLAGTLDTLEAAVGTLFVFRDNEPVGTLSCNAGLMAWRLENAERAVHVGDNTDMTDRYGVVIGYASRLSIGTIA